MKIENNSPTRPLDLVSTRSSGKAGQTTGTTNAPASEPASVTHLSSATQDASLDIDQARVDEIRQAIRDGKLHLDAGKIADGLLASIQAQLDGDK